MHNVMVVTELHDSKLFVDFVLLAAKAVGNEWMQPHSNRIGKQYQTVDCELEDGGQAEQVGAKLNFTEKKLSYDHDAVCWVFEPSQLFLYLYTIVTI